MDGRAKSEVDIAGPWERDNLRFLPLAPTGALNPASLDMCTSSRTSSASESAALTCPVPLLVV